MLLLPAILVVAVLAGYALGGRLRSVAARRIRLWWLAPLGLALQVAPLPEVSGEAGRLLPPAALAVSFALILLVALANWRQPGFVVVAVGLALNLAVVVANRGMPVSEAALRAANGEEDVARLRGASGKHHLATEEDVLLPLADVIGMGGPVNAVISVGDAIAYSGAGVWLVLAMTRGPRPQDWGGPRAPRARSSGTRRRRSSPAHARSRS